MGKRGYAIPLPLLGEWWVRLARKIIQSDPRDLRTLGKDLAKHVSGKAKFDHAILSKFTTGVHDQRTGRQVDPTFDLVDALCSEFSRLPRPMFFARSYEEAVHLQVTRERYDGKNDNTPYAVELSTITELPTGRSRRKVTSAAAETPATTTKRRSRTA